MPDVDLQEVYRNDFPEFVTYEYWHEEPYVRPMYDIIGGRRVYLPWQSIYHGDIRMNIAMALHEQEDDAGIGLIGIAPTDIMIHKKTSLHEAPRPFCSFRRT